MCIRDRAQGGVREVFVRKAGEEGVSIVFACDSPLYAANEQKNGYIEYSHTPWGTLRGELTGLCQSKNAATIMAALRLIEPHFSIDPVAVAEGFAHVCELTGLMGRWMVVETSPVRVICDTGHNVGGWHDLGQSLSDIASKGTLHVVAGFVNDKDIAHIVGLMPRDANYYFVCPSVERGRPADSTAEYYRAAGLNGVCCGSVADGVRSALTVATPGDTVFVGGSTFVVADFLKTRRNSR